jgi:hypothetical protein
MDDIHIQIIMPMAAPSRSAEPLKLAPHPDQSSSKINLHRGNDIRRPRDKTPKIAFWPETVSAETETQPQKPANCGHLGRLREILRFERLRGGPRRIRTAKQTVMSGRLLQAVGGKSRFEGAARPGRPGSCGPLGRLTSSVRDPLGLNPKSTAQALQASGAGGTIRQTGRPDGQLPCRAGAVHQWPP